METTKYLEVVVSARQRAEHLYATINSFDEIRHLARECGAGRGDLIEVVEVVAPFRRQYGPRGEQLVLQTEEATRTTVQRGIVTRAKDMTLKAA